jgi:hypothetical protein
MPRGRVKRVAPVEHDPSLEEIEPVVRADGEPPADWLKGALLNVRNHGAEYIVTLHPAEYDPRHEDQCMKFTNVGECQSFVSAWYARESHDPRAR